MGEKMGEKQTAVEELEEFLIGDLWHAIKYEFRNEYDIFKYIKRHFDLMRVREQNNVSMFKEQARKELIEKINSRKIQGNVKDDGLMYNFGLALAKDIINSVLGPEEKE